MTDPHPRNQGNGFDMLEAAGVEVVRDAASDAARALNPGHVSLHERGRPFVRIKLAATLDGARHSITVTASGLQDQRHDKMFKSGGPELGVDHRRRHGLADDPALGKRCQHCAAFTRGVGDPSQTRLCVGSRGACP